MQQSQKGGNEQHLRVLLLHVPHTNGAIITTREELVAVEGETCHTISMPCQGSHVLVRIGIPHTNGAITMITSREELVAVEGEKTHIVSMPSQGSQVLVRIGIPHTNGQIITTREELLAVEGETSHHQYALPR